jgi:hypothetical protein
MILEFHCSLCLKGIELACNFSNLNYCWLQRYMQNYDEVELSALGMGN